MQSKKVMPAGINPNRIHQGHRNSQLTDNGLNQAKKIAIRLRNENFDIAYSSDLDRTINTAQEILKFHPGLKLIKVRELREQKKGIHEGKPYGDIDKELKRRNIKFHEYKPIGGESFMDIWNNMIKFYDNIKIKHKNDFVLVVGHGGPILCLITYLHGDKINNHRKYAPIKNTAVTVIDVDDNRNHKFSMLNSNDHLI